MWLALPSPVFGRLIINGDRRLNWVLVHLRIAPSLFSHHPFLALKSNRITALNERNSRHLLILQHPLFWLAQILITMHRFSLSRMIF